MSDAVELKLSAARMRLVLDTPFLGALVMRLPLQAVEADWCPATATDMRRLYFNPAYIEPLSLAQVKFVLAHEALHCALSHFSRRQHRVRQRWDLACDFAINPLLLDEGLVPPPDALLLERFRGMSAEEIYPCLEDNDERETPDRHLYDDAGEPGEDQGAATPPQPQPHSEDGEQGTRPPNAQELQGLDERWQDYVAGAAQAALQAGKLSGAMARAIDQWVQPRLPWRALLARFVSALGRNDYSYTRPTRREGAAILPSLASRHVDLVVGIDTSSSIDADDLRAFLAEVSALKGQVNARVTLQACDTELDPAGPWEYEVWEPLDPPMSLSGGGGTRFEPLFEWLDGQGRRPDLLLYFTDAEGRFPSRSPDYPVVWLVKGAAGVPWGERIQLN